MLNFLKLTFGTLIGGSLLYIATVTASLRRIPSNKEFLSPSQNSSLNISLANWDGKLSKHMVIGSSAALKNLSGSALSDSTQEWKVIGGFGLDPNQALELIKELNVIDSQIIVPISVIGINKINTGSQRKLKLNTLRLTTLQTFYHNEKLLKLTPEDNSHLNFDRYGNCLVTDKEISLETLKEDNIQTIFQVDTVGIRYFIKQCESLAMETNNHITLVTTPFCTTLGDIDSNQRKLVCQIHHHSAHCTLIHHICDETNARDFIDAYHFNATGAYKFGLVLKEELRHTKPNALQQP